MPTSPATNRIVPYRSIIFKNVLLFVLILVVAAIPLSLSHYEDSRDAEIKTLAAKLEVAAERGRARLNATAIEQLVEVTHRRTSAYKSTLKVLRNLERDFGVDDAILMRRQDDGRYTHIVVGSDDFDIGEDVQIHEWFPPTYEATEQAWRESAIMHSRLFGGKVIDETVAELLRSLCRLLTFTKASDTRLWHQLCGPEGTDYNYDTGLPQFVQINAPIALNGQVVAVLMLNKHANQVAEAVRAKTLKLIGLTLGIIVIGMALFAYASAHMLRPLKNLTTAAGEVAQGNLEVVLPQMRRRDEVGRLTTTFSTMLDGLRQRDFIRDAFGRYLSKEIVEELLGSPDGLKLGGEMREITIMVSDLRGFTSMASHLSPHDVIDILNRYLGRMVDILMTHGGTVDEFQGDGILAFFGAPIAAADDRERAVACAIEMHIALVEINAEQRRRGLPELRMGIGINTGEVIVGNIGSEKRSKYGAVGSTINEAYRIESYTVGGQILVSSTVYEGVCDLVQIRSTQDVQFKGLQEPVTLYDVVGLQGRYACALPQQKPEQLITLASPLAVACYPVNGKTVSTQAVTGTITRLAESSAEVSLEDAVTLYSNMRLQLESPDEPALSEVYAKVVALNQEGEATAAADVSLGFTSLPDDVKAFLRRQRASAHQTV